jgi:radical SAM superfamily enzyme YgiQ (UPF0313 family)
MRKKLVFVTFILKSGMDEAYGVRKLQASILDDPHLSDKFSISILQLKLYETILQNVQNIADLSPDIVGFSSMITNIRYIVDISERLKQLDKSPTIILGGPQVNNREWDVFEFTNAIDLVIRGEGETAINKVLNNYLLGKELADGPVNGTVYQLGGNTIFQGDSNIIRELDQTIPAYKYFKEAEPGLVYGLETSRGCYYKCAYCHMPSIKFRKYSMDYVKSEIENIHAAGIKKIVLLDASFTYSYKRAETIANRLKEYGIRYTFTAKPEELNSAFIDLFINTGAYEISMGLQSSNPYTLELMNRTLREEIYKKNIHELVEKTKGTDITVKLDVMSGLPGDNYKSFLVTLDFAFDLGPHRIGVYPLMCLPGTQVFRKVDEYKISYQSPMEHKNMTISLNNCHMFGLVTENFTFSAEESEKARKTCIVFATLQDFNFIPYIADIIKTENVKLSDWLIKFTPLVPDDFTKIVLAQTSNNLFKKRLIARYLTNALINYCKSSSNTEIVESVNKFYNLNAVYN